MLALLPSKCLGSVALPEPYTTVRTANFPLHTQMHFGEDSSLTRPFCTHELQCAARCCVPKLLVETERVPKLVPSRRATIPALNLCRTKPPFPAGNVRFSDYRSPRAEQLPPSESFRSFIAACYCRPVYLLGTTTATPCFVLSGLRIGVSLEVLR